MKSSIYIASVKGEPLLYKIGISKNPRERIVEVGRANKQHLELRFVLPLPIKRARNVEHRLKLDLEPWQSGRYVRVARTEYFRTSLAVIVAAIEKYVRRKHIFDFFVTR